MTHEPSSRDWHGAHHPWSYGPRCFLWLGSDIAGINFLPLATEMRAWLKRKGNLSLVLERGEEGKGGYSNPYTFSGASLGVIFSRVVNSWHDYTNSESIDHDEVAAEIERLRIYNEVVLYAARFCEAVIKQLLYCTQVPEKRFKGMALGALLESPCPSCKRANGKQPHSVSMVGTLAHPFHLCLEFEHCAMDHMALVNTLRNTEAAHSDIQMLDIRTVAESKAQLAKDCDEVLSGFLHMLSHLENLEQCMLEDLALKGDAIMLLKLKGLAPEDCNFDLVPGQAVVVQKSGD
ncbi:hypothetical protein [Collimonas antrihumi]|uniref:hypothetical protein n=1 Tax=Collimonas antrihumi TaxID=1940615 RepID=UPI001B8AF96F|nr:hypothetical protein [Collimonas antrihumi]